MPEGDQIDGQSDSTDGPDDTDGGGQPSAADATAPATGNELWTLPWVREMATVLIALGIVSVTLVLLTVTFFRIDEPAITADALGDAALMQAQEEARDATFQDRLIILNISIGILGVVTGYFFGRVPAERRAEAAEKAAGVASDAAETNSQAAAAAKASKAEAVRQAASAARDAAKRDATETNRNALAGVRAAKTHLKPSVDATKTLSRADPPAPLAAELAAAYAELEALERSLS